MMMAPAVKLIMSVLKFLTLLVTHATSAMSRLNFRPSLSAMVPRMAAPKIAPMVVPAVVISVSEYERACPRS